MTTNNFTDSVRWMMSSDGRANGSVASQWKKDVQLRERQSAIAEYDALRRAQSENMARLKTLRLARDAANALRPAAQAAPAKAPTRASTVRR